MVFISTDIKSDLKSKIYFYLEDNNEYTITKKLVSLISNYMNEVKIIKEIEKFSIDIIDEQSININFTKNDINDKLEINIPLDIRKMKIKKIIGYLTF
jgi:hypothetical protein